MADVTGTYTDSSGAPLPAGIVREVSATPSRPFTTLDGRNVSGRPQTVVPDAATGAYVLNLVPTIPGVFYSIVGTYLVPGSHKQRDHFEERIVVPPEGGSIADLTVVDTMQGLVWVKDTPPPMTMQWHYIDPAYDPDSGLPLPVYTAPDGTTVEHGELVEWSA